MSIPNLLHRIIEYYRFSELQKKGMGVTEFDSIYLRGEYKLDWKLYRQLREAIQNPLSEVNIEYQ